MEQSENVKALELSIDAKRGRGRPAKADALTQAERAKRYRANKKQNPVIKSDATENQQLRQQLEQADSERNAASRQNDYLREEVKRLREMLDQLQVSLKREEQNHGVTLKDLIVTRDKLSAALEKKTKR